jgi:hypothetical protein
MDELGYVSWDENHRNGQLDQVPWLIKRDRNRARDSQYCLAPPDPLAMHC